MAATIAPEPTDWTVADLYRRFGAIPFYRICSDPAPGTATEQDVIAIRDREDLLYELVDGILVRKTMGSYEAYLVGVLVRILGAYVTQRRLGVVLPSDGMLRLNPGVIRIPDVSFPRRALPETPLPPRSDLVDRPGPGHRGLERGEYEVRR